MVTFYHFVRGALLYMMGRSDTDLPLVRVKSQNAIRKRPGRTEYQRGVVTTAADGSLRVRITGNQPLRFSAGSDGAELLVWATA